MARLKPPPEFAAAAEVSRNRLARLIDRRGVAGLKEMYDSAHDELGRKLSHLVAAGKGDTFTAHQMRAMLGQIKQGQVTLAHRMTGALGEVSAEAQYEAMRGLVKDLRRLEKHFEGAAGPLRLEHAARFRGLLEAGRSSLMQSHAASMSRYGADLVQRMEQSLSMSMLTGETSAQAIQRILEVANLQWYQGERIVRTELAWSFNSAQVAGMVETAKEHPDLVMRWDATVDRRVCLDCAAMDGKTAKPGQSFDGQDPPPLHPQCRCIVTPFMERWAGD